MASELSLGSRLQISDSPTYTLQPYFLAATALFGSAHARGWLVGNTANSRFIQRWPEKSFLHSCKIPREPCGSEVGPPVRSAPSKPAKFTVTPAELSGNGLRHYSEIAKVGSGSRVKRGCGDG